VKRRDRWCAAALPLAMILFLLFLLSIDGFWPAPPEPRKTNALVRCQRDSPPWSTAECGPTSRRP
jgi:hypothetical protein